MTNSNEVESEPLCDSSAAISSFTFLNFLAASISLAGVLASNTNSNNNNNNNNNNDNNNNDNNINIGRLGNGVFRECVRTLATGNKVKCHLHSTLYFMQPGIETQPCNQRLQPGCKS